SYFMSSSRIYFPSNGIFIGNYFTGWNGWGGWGWYPNWYGRRVVVNQTFFTRYGYRPGPAVTYNRPYTVNRPNSPYVNRPSVPYVNRPEGGRRYETPRAPAVIRQPQASPRQQPGFRQQPSFVAPTPQPGRIAPGRPAPGRGPGQPFGNTTPRPNNNFQRGGMRNSP